MDHITEQRLKAEKPMFWERVFAANHATLQGFLRRRVVHAWDVQDLAQEVYVRMLGIDEARAKAIVDPRAYLFTVASNLVKEHAILEKRHFSNVDITQVLPELEAPQASAEEEVERTRRQHRISAMLDRLPQRCKAVLVMQHRDGMSYAEIAERLGVSTHMVKKYVVKALTLCRAEMARED